MTDDADTYIKESERLRKGQIKFVKEHEYMKEKIMSLVREAEKKKII